MGNNAVLDLNLAFQFGSAGLPFESTYLNATSHEFRVALVCFEKKKSLSKKK